MKRFLAAVLCFLLMLTSLSGFAFATSNDPSVQDTDVITEQQDQPADTPDIELDDQTPAFAELPVGEQYLYLQQLASEDEIEAVLATLSEKQCAALMSYAQTVEQIGDEPQTVVFTAAGPFMPPVSVTPTRRMLMRAASNGEDSNGLELSKEAFDNGDGTFTIRMEAYTTGEVISTTKTIPVDIVLVLDQSGSMAYDFDGNSTSTNTARRQYAMKQAVNNFISSVSEKYSSEADHRISVVTFGSSASTLQGWTYVDEAGKTTLQGKISSLPNSPSGATNISAGMGLTENLMGSGYSYAGTNTQRQKVVVVFTDGVPTTQTNFNVDVANGAISSANALKNSGVTIYSVGIFKGADPNKIHGDYYYRAVIADTPCDGSVNSYWGTTNLSSSNANDFADPDVPAGNRFLNYISNNYTAANIGLRFDESDGLFGGYKWIITANYAGNNAGYYLTADNASALNSIFQTISDQIQTANIDLGNETVVKDIASEYFDLPQNVSEIKLYTAEAKADGTFDADVPASGVTASVEGNAVTVVGFDYNENFVSDTVKSDGTYGRKLIIEFVVTPKADFLGGNDVPTNDWENTAVYDKAGNLVEKFADENTTPTVNVSVGQTKAEVHTRDKNVYLFNNLTIDQIRSDATVTIDGITLDLNPSAVNYGLESWQTEYVNVHVQILNANGDVLADGFQNLSEDTTYSIVVTIEPKTDGSGSVGTPAVGNSDSADSEINIFTPELTYQDSAVFFGDLIPTFDSHLSDTVWMHDGDEADAETMGAAPELDITYLPESGKIHDSRLISPQDVTVDVSVKLGDQDITTRTAFVHQDCDTDCGWSETNLDGSPAFLIHAKTCELTVQKTGSDQIDENQSFVFHIVGQDTSNNTINLTVAVFGNGSKTIKGLPIGNYVVTEETEWSWRYTADASSKTIELNTENPEQAVSFSNSRSNVNWLNNCAYVDNWFGKKETND